MKTEIERKFLVKSNSFKQEADSQHRIFQGYLSKDRERTVRVRVKDQKGWLTVKGKSNQGGTSRLEWETLIPLEEARALLKLALGEPIEKIRYVVPCGELTFEVDVFLKPKNNLILAEIELPKANTQFKKPEWLGEEVTGNPSYYNSTM
ncbi:CYTH domain-containing protein [Flavobacteriaceae bacterium]|jgi:CYTH domain-containing protein|nr:CYTH domain-containing protein [Flavobacteriaceae bacterium]